MELFGFTIKKKGKERDEKLTPAFVSSRAEEDGSSTFLSGGYFGQFVDLDGQDSTKSDAELIYSYRMAAEQPECDLAIENIVNESISFDEGATPVYLNLDEMEANENVKKTIREEFDEIVSLLNFNTTCSDIFRRWYVDGRLYYQIIINESKPSLGIREIRPIDATKIRKVKEVKEKIDPKTRVKIIEKIDEYFLYQENGIDQGSNSGLKISPDSICYVPSGYLDASRKKVLSPLQKAIKPVNQLRLMEDSLVMYRVSRAPERRIFYIDVGNLPKGKAEEYLREVMSKYRNKIVYDAQTGEIRDDRKHMAMLEDFWLPRREGGRGTEITTLPGGENLGQIEDILFFQKKLFRALNVPLTRLEPESGFSLGRSSEISRDELNFQKFVYKLRRRFSVLFYELLRVQLILKGIIKESEWDGIKSGLWIDFLKDSYFSELKNLELTQDRLNLMRDIGDLVGKYYSMKWIRKNVLQQTDEEIEEIDKEIAEEKKSGMYGDDDRGF